MAEKSDHARPIMSGRTGWYVPVMRRRGRTDRSHEAGIRRIGSILRNQETVKVVAGAGLIALREQWEERVVLVEGDDALSNQADIADGGLNFGIVDGVDCASDGHTRQHRADGDGCR